MKVSLAAIASLLIASLGAVVASPVRAHAFKGRPADYSVPINVTLAEVAPRVPSSAPLGATRAVLNTGAPPLTSATGTAIWAGQAAAVRFTAPPDVAGFGARLVEIQLVVAASRFARSLLRLSVVEDSGSNSPGTVVLEQRDISVPAYDGRVTITAASPGNLYLFPGEIFWVVLEGNAGYVQDAASWLDSVNGVAWTSFNVWNSDVENNAGEQVVMDKDVGVVGRWIVERSRSASSIRVLVQ